MKKFLMAFLLVACGSANAALVSFGSGGNANFTTGSDVSYLNGNTHSVPAAGYKSVADATASDYVAFNPHSVSPSTFTWANAGTFDLTSFVIAGAWGSQTLKIEGFNGASLVGSADYFVTAAASTFSAGWSALTHFIITTGNDHIDTVGGGSGQHWALNDITINENVSAVPVPAAVFMFAPALLGLLGFRRKTRA